MSARFSADNFGGAQDPSRGSTARGRPVAKLYWPSRCTAAKSGYLIGWNIRSFTCCVADVVSDYGLEELESALVDVANDKSLARLRKYCEGNPIVLGEWHDGAGGEGVFDAKSEERHVRRARRRSADLWIRCYPSSSSGGKPTLHEVHCCGVKYNPDSHSIIYDPLRAGLHFTPSIRFRRIVARDRALPALPGEHRPRGSNLVETDIILRQINATQKMVACASVALTGAPRAQAPLWDRIMSSRWNLPARLAKWLCVGAAMVLRLLISVLLPVIERPFALPWHDAPLRLVDVSATAQQCAFRMRQLALMPPHSVGAAADLHDVVGSTATATSIGSRDAICIGLLDVGLGLLLIALLLNEELNVAKSCLQALRWVNNQLLTDMLRDHVEWLIDIPAGLKLNLGMNTFIGKFFIGCVDNWSWFLRFAKGYEVAMARMAVGSSVFGLSTLMAISSDVLSAMTAHLYAFYRLSSFVYKVTMRIMRSLWLLFRGKKWNDLRKRTDSAEYDTEQLLLGTLVFTLLSFLMPTVAVFYTFFVLVWLSQVFVQVVLTFIRLSLNHVPLYSILVYFLSPGSIPGGIRFEVLPVRASAEHRARRASRTGADERAESSRVGRGLPRSHSVGYLQRAGMSAGGASARAGDDYEQAQTVTYVQLRSRAATLTATLEEYFFALGWMLRHYSPPKALKAYLTGELILAPGLLPTQQKVSAVPSPHAFYEWVQKTVGVGGYVSFPR